MSPRRSLIGRPYVEAPQHPAPTYPQYAQLLADAKEAERRDGRHIDPRKLYKMRNLGRSWEWKTCVLGYAGDGLATVLEMQLLLLADERDLNPPLPQWLVEKRSVDAKADAERAAALKLEEDREQVAWDEVRKDCQVEVEVLRNGTARPYNGRWRNLGHVVPVVDAESGMGRRRRRHPAGRAVCESEQRARPLDLSGGEGGPATCVRCLKYVPQLRPAGDPQ